MHLYTVNTSRKSNLNKTVDAICTLINNNQLIAIPTETVYGIIGDANSIQVLSKIYAAKERSSSKPISLFVPDKKYFDLIGHVNEQTRALIHKYTPGPITLILRTKENSIVSDHFNGKIGLRMPKDKLSMAILKRINRPLFATSLNISGQPPISHHKHLDSPLQKNISAFVYNSTPNHSSSNTASTIIDCSTDEPQILRLGQVTESDILLTIKQQKSSTTA